MFSSIQLKNILLILCGSAIYALGVVNLNIANDLSEGGLTGLTLIIFALFNIDPGLSNLLINIPLFLVGWKLVGHRMLIYTIVGAASFSLFLSIFRQYLMFDIPLKDDMILVALFAAVFKGVGVGVIFRYGGTTGGTDIAARIGNKYFGWSMGKTLFIIDIMIITSSLLYLNYREVMYTLVSVFIASRVIDIVQQGAYTAKSVMIISEKNDAIANKLAYDMNRGVTLWGGKGGYTGAQKEVLYCVVNRNEIFRLKSTINHIDPSAFIAVSDVHEVSIQGYSLDEHRNLWKIDKEK
ncbi:YitT family protein [Lentibacillus cibarius]|uniref:YitT family protein n=1 Tax=Lentibacillus cibarius TaxID=2583219 RepID=A0A549YN11_9BACI|nr:YitT family protein [Lentibacillus cibarius]